MMPCQALIMTKQTVLARTHAQFSFPPWFPSSVGDMMPRFVEDYVDEHGTWHTSALGIEMLVVPGCGEAASLRFASCHQGSHDDRVLGDTARVGFGRLFPLTWLPLLGPDLPPPPPVACPPHLGSCPPLPGQLPAIQLPLHLGSWPILEGDEEDANAKDATTVDIYPDDSVSAEDANAEDATTVEDGRCRGLTYDAKDANAEDGEDFGIMIYPNDSVSQGGYDPFRSGWRAHRHRTRTGDSSASSASSPQDSHGRLAPRPRRRW